MGDLGDAGGSLDAPGVLPGDAWVSMGQSWCPLLRGWVNLGELGPDLEHTKCPAWRTLRSVSYHTWQLLHLRNGVNDDESASVSCSRGYSDTGTEGL